MQRGPRQPGRPLGLEQCGYSEIDEITTSSEWLHCFDTNLEIMKEKMQNFIEVMRDISEQKNAMCGFFDQARNIEAGT